MYIYIYVRMYTYMYVHVYMYIYMYIYESIRIFEESMHAFTGVVEHQFEASLRRVFPSKMANVLKMFATNPIR